MSAKQRLNEVLEKAGALRDAGKFAEAWEILNALKADPERAALGPPTAIALPRRLHSAMLKLAKAEGDVLKRIAYQFHLVPPPEALAKYAAFTIEERRAFATANREAVPPVIHQIWIGTLPVPEATHAWAAHAGKHGYGYCLWREKDLRAVGVYENAAFREMIERGDFPGAVDVARYIILEQEGGIYLDCDWYPARDDISFHDRLPMTGLSALPEEIPRMTGLGSLLLANSFLVTPPHHPVFKRMNEILPSILKDMPTAPAWWSTGPLIFTLLARGGSVAIADASFVAGSVSRGATLETVTALCRDRQPDSLGLLVAWKSW